MDQTRLLRIAHRMHPLLLQELQYGIDIRRMLSDARYARDVLLVCDALPGHDLASLAQHFRAAASDAVQAAAVSLASNQRAAPLAGRDPIPGTVVDSRLDPQRGWWPSGTDAAALVTSRQPAARRWFTAGRRAER